MNSPFLLVITPSTVRATAQFSCLFFLIYFYSVCACMHVCVCVSVRHISVGVHRGQKRVSDLRGTGATGDCDPHRWVQETKLRSTGRAASAPNSRATSPSLPLTSPSLLPFPSLETVIETHIWEQEKRKDQIIRISEHPLLTTPRVHKHESMNIGLSILSEH